MYLRIPVTLTNYYFLCVLSFLHWIINSEFAISVIFIIYAIDRLNNRAVAPSAVSKTNFPEAPIVAAQEKQKEPNDDVWGYLEAQAAFLGPSLWENSDLKVSFVIACSVILYTSFLKIECNYQIMTTWSMSTLYECNRFSHLTNRLIRSL
jgi:hypothetical protein